MLIKVLESDEINLVLAYYRKTGYSKQVNSEDIVLAALESNQIIGAVRLCPQDDYLVLRGMQVIKEYQRQKIGTALLYKCADVIQNTTCYCLPYKHLVTFYQQAQFYEIDSRYAPTHLQERLNNYSSLGLNLTIMCRKAS
ncbi:hypothetical protein CAL7716_051700 [Calothrix sp. PCC 7716]|nr:hypothetical protein CAL7716_051700 [Calothrix sp. PCC 7716]